jgi:hypothetical protein
MRFFNELILLESENDLKTMIRLNRLLGISFGLFPKLRVDKDSLSTPTLSSYDKIILH